MAVQKLDAHIQERDKALLRALAESFRVLDWRQIAELFPMGSATRIQFRLKQLRDAGYLSVRPVPTEKGGFQNGYYLGPRAEQVFAPLERASINRVREEAAHLAERGLRHRMLVDSIHIRFLTASRDNPNFRLLTWVDQYCKEWEELRAYGLRVQADGYAEYILLLHFDGLYSFFLEADRGLEHISTIRRKVEAYAAFAQTHAYEKLFAAGPFRVLFVAASDKGARRLAQIAAQSAAREIFWVVSWSALRTQNLFDNIFMRPGEPGLHSILEKV